MRGINVGIQLLDEAIANNTLEDKYGELLLEFGLELVKTDATKAFTYFNLSKSPRARIALGSIHYYGIGCTQNKTLGETILNDIKQEHTAAYIVLGHIYIITNRKTQGMNYLNYGLLQ